MKPLTTRAQVIISILITVVILSFVFIFISGKQSKGPLETEIVNSIKGDIKEFKETVLQENSSQERDEKDLKIIQEKQDKTISSLNSLRREFEILKAKENEIPNLPHPNTDSDRAKFFSSRYDLLTD